MTFANVSAPEFVKTFGDLSNRVGLYIEQAHTHTHTSTHTHTHTHTLAHSKVGSPI